jgi:indolepyruvate ferredoxin oxidoreductase
VAIASIPEKIRGFGPVKERHLFAAKGEEAELLRQFRSGGRDVHIAAAAE